MEISKLIDKLKTASLELNFASDELGKLVVEIDASLKALNMGVVTWLLCAASHESRRDQQGGIIEGWERSFGYARVKGKWGLACQQAVWKDGRRKVESWLFNEAPRWMRVEMIGKLPELLEEMVKRSEDMRVKLVNKRHNVELMLDGIRKAQEELKAGVQGKV